LDYFDLSILGNFRNLISVRTPSGVRGFAFAEAASGIRAPNNR